MPAPRSWDLFCRVVDNFGDAAVCWRLARALAGHTGARTRLWIDDLSPLAALVPQLDPNRERQSFAGVEVRCWRADTDFGPPADVAIDAFGGGVPDAYAQAMAARMGRPRPLWIVLEYLSAEPWVAAHHRLPSPHPRLPLERWFFFPGFGAGTGGLLREPGLGERRARFLADPAQRAAFWRDCGFAPPAAEATVVSLFAYENPAAGELLAAWAAGAQPLVAAVPAGRIRGDLAAWLGQEARALRTGEVARRGALELRWLPFLAQDRYDELLWACDWNFVRGEDSFVRAQWAERPFVWQAYPQAGDAHLAKLEAFLGAYRRGLAPALAGPLTALWRGWNGAGPQPSAIGPAWTALASGQAGPALAVHARAWAGEAGKAGDLARNLINFCADRLN